MSPTARGQTCEDLQDGGFPIRRTQKLEASELQALYGEDEDDTWCPSGGEQQAVDDGLADDLIAEESMNEFAYTLSHHNSNGPSAYTHLHRQVFVSNEAYYHKLEELKKMHLKNIADLQRRYLNQPASAQRDSRPDDLKDQAEREKVAPSPQPNIHSDQSDACRDEEVSEPEDEPEWEPHLKQANLTPPTNPPPKKNMCSFLKNSSSLSPANQQPLRVEKMDTQRRSSKVTIPQPFQMTLREEQRKLRRVKTRSEVELENERLKKELDELKECGRRFRATPAPASTHLPPYEIVNTRHGQRQPAKERVEHQGRHGNHRPQKKPSPGRPIFETSSQGQERRVQGKPSKGHHLHGNRHYSSPALPQRPFSFIEREQKKKEMKLHAELNNLTPREERWVFKARPVPRSLYRSTWQDFHLYGAISLNSRVQEQIGNSTAPPGYLEELQEETNEEDENKEDEAFLSDRGWGEKRRSLERVKKGQHGERDWTYIHPLRRASVSCSHEVLPACKSDYISV